MLFKRTFFLLFLLTILTSAGIAQNQTDLKQWLSDYLDAVHQDDWATSSAVKKFVNEDPETWKVHSEFRAAYKDLSWSIEHFVTDGENVIAILEVEGRWIGKFSNDVLADAEPTGKMVKWQETWSFNVVDGKFGDKFHILGAGQTKMKSAGVNCLPSQ